MLYCMIQPQFYTVLSQVEQALFHPAGTHTECGLEIPETVTIHKW